eukprot:Rhum_TRINITY_DN22842_c0_g1::Rhum_TRINITY_DN22842_c0_g1_i1::g.176191::m.176191
MQRSLAVAASRSVRGTRRFSACTVRLAADSSRSTEELQRKLTPAEQGESIRQQCRNVSVRQNSVLVFSSTFFFVMAWYMIIQTVYDSEMNKYEGDEDDEDDSDDDEDE